MQCNRLHGLENKIKVKAREKVPESLASMKWSSKEKKRRGRAKKKKTNKSNDRRIFQKHKKTHQFFRFKRLLKIEQYEKQP